MSLHLTMWAWDCAACEAGSGHFPTGPAHAWDLENIHWMIEWTNINPEHLGNVNLSSPRLWSNKVGTLGVTELALSLYQGQRASEGMKLGMRKITGVDANGWKAMVNSLCGRWVLGRPGFDFTALLLMSSVTLGKLLNLSEPPFSLLKWWNGSTHLVRLLWAFRWVAQAFLSLLPSSSLLCLPSVLWESRTTWELSPRVPVPSCPIGINCELQRSFQIFYLPHFKK